MKSKLFTLLLVVFLFSACGEKEKDINKEIHSLKLALDEDDPSELKLEEIKEKIDKLKETAYDKPRYWVQKARFELVCGYSSKQCPKEGVWKRALKVINKAKSLSPNDIEVLSVSGHILRNLKRYEAAEKDLEKALSIDSKHAWANLNYAALMADTGIRMGINLKDKTYMERKHNILKKGLSSLKVILEGDYRDREKKAALDKCDQIATWVELEERLYCHRMAIELDFFESSKKKAWARGNYSLQLIKAEQFSEAKKYAEDAIKLMNYPIARQMLAASYLGLWIESNYEDDSLFESAYEVYPSNQLDPVFTLRTRMDDITFFKQLEKKGVDLNGYDRRGATLLSKSLAYHVELKEKNYDRVVRLVTELNLEVGKPYLVSNYPKEGYTKRTAIESMKKSIEFIMKENPKYRNNIELEVWRKLREFFKERLKNSNELNNT